MDLADRLRLYIRLFSKRPDVSIWEETWQDLEGSPELPASAAFLADRSLRFVWGFERGSAGDHPSSDGGVLHLHPGHEQGEGWSDADAFPLGDAEQSLMLDELVEEGTSHLIVEPGKSIADAVPVFYNANDESIRRFESLEAYLTLGARRAFAWYWP